ncbi:hypothetical protein N7495_005747 [Penicillium taxi]|uniref:uncharacterized protein n=1 Tax=Penicillium taxi TaxID=168475 RepID=UPI002544FFD6|nr:uncharacterized protein N7495_005747 [Penicillium taxi]KAJ5894056.1 hypothetical protein N7495_005747 [Penicillium taxi]
MPPKGATRAGRTAAASSASSSLTTNAEDTESKQNSSTSGVAPKPYVQRLQSLKKTKPSGSITAGAKAGKFKVKAIERKSKEEREVLEKAEAEAHALRNKRTAAALKLARGDHGHRGGSFRGRGGSMRVGAGPFGGGRGGRGGAFSGRVGMGGDDSDDSDSYEDDLRVNIDQINLDSDNDETGKGKGRASTNSKLQPVRAQRYEHTERAVHVNEESSATIEVPVGAPVEEVAQPENISSVEGSDDGPRVKAEPIDDEDTVMVTEVPRHEDDGLPAMKKMVRTSVPPSPRKKAPKAPLSQPKRDPRELLRTTEEIEEYDRHLEDLKIIRDLLSFDEVRPEKPQSVDSQPSAPTTDDDEGESQGVTKQEHADGEEAEDTEVEHKLAGQLFLMQFPPMTPNLVIPGSTGDTALPSTETTAQSETEAADKAAADTAVAEKAASNKARVLTAAMPWALPAGRVGKLNLHKSGRVTMDWGGISFEVDRGSGADYVQEALIVSEPEAEEAGQPQRDANSRKEAWSMGQLQGKFTVNPNWDQIL